MYNFKSIQIVPDAKEMVDIVLSRTQRKTPTVVHPGWVITRIRGFYQRKIKYTQQTYHDKLTQILDDFPRMDDIHPFYADLMNVLYDKDHYKLALGQLNTCRHIIDNLAKDYVRSLKFADNLFKCKSLKRAAMGRMCTLMRKQGPSLAYLEEVRKHLSRLPAIDPTARTLLVTGYPNVGKSSFMNKVTRADVDVQPYAFTTKSLFVGHMDYKYQQWQIIDTPGILDHPLEERNTIEMQAITALAHLPCAILYFIDISEQCGFTIDQQISLFENIKPLFTSKPLVIVATKIDATPLGALDPTTAAKIDALVTSSGAMFHTMSNITGEGVSEVKNAACDVLLKQRVASKMKGKKVGDIMNRISVTLPRPRDGKVRAAHIPASVAARRAARAAAPVVLDGDDDEDLHGGGGGGGGGGMGGFDFGELVQPRPDENGDLERIDLTAGYILRDPSWRTDVIPEIMDGKNILDFVDADILASLDALEREEEAIAAEMAAKGALGDDTSDEDEATKSLAEEIRRRKTLVVSKHRREKNKNRSTMPRTAKGPSATAVEAHLEGVGIEADKLVKSMKRVSRKRGRSMTRDEDEDMGGDDEEEDRPGFHRSKSRTRSKSRDRSRARTASRGDPKEGEGFGTAKQKDAAYKLMKKKQRTFIMEGRASESDRKIGTKMPKHLFSGKRGMGKTDRR